MEEGEDPQSCLIREIREEIAIQIRIVAELKPCDHSYSSNKRICLIPFFASWEGGEIQLLEHSEIAWLDREELFSVDWAAADVPIVHELQEKWVKLVEEINATR